MCQFSASAVNPDINKTPEVSVSDVNGVNFRRALINNGEQHKQICHRALSLSLHRVIIMIHELFVAV